ncbi:MAG: ATP-binding protein [Candidatus Omnitrophota bacterium]
MEIPIDALREAVINAVVHRDYFERGARVMVEIFDNRIEVSSPGGLPEGLKKVDFGKKSVLRNPILADLLNRVEYIEKMGTGIRKIRDLMKQAGLSPVKFEFTSFVTAIFRRPGQIVVQKSSQKSSQKILVLIQQNSRVTIDELATSLHLTDRAIKKNLAQMKKTGLLKRIGPDKGGHWEVVFDRPSV